MPHIVIEYSRSLEAEISPEKMMQTAHDTAFASGEFGEQDIKVRTLAFGPALIGGKPARFIHITVKLLDGRSEERKKEITGAILQAFQAYNLDVNCISVDARDMIRASYSKVQTA